MEEDFVHNPRRGAFAVPCPAVQPQSGGPHAVGLGLTTPTRRCEAAAQSRAEEDVAATRAIVTIYPYGYNNTLNRTFYTRKGIFKVQQTLICMASTMP